MEEKYSIPEGNLSLRFDLPASLKAKFERSCQEEEKTMTEVIINLIKRYLGDE